MRKNEELSNRFRKFFQLPTSPVAIKISKEELAGQRPNAPSLFCDFVRKAAHEGQSNVITENDLHNFTARVILGFTEPKYVEIYPRVKPAQTRSILVSPLEKIDMEPDVVVTITDPARMMQVVQVLYRATRKKLEADMTCEASAIAGEVTALPYMEKKPNLTLLCGGARGIAGYVDQELAMGIPFDQFVQLVDKLVEPTLTAALCGCILDDIPRHVKEAFIGFGFDKGTDHFYGDFNGKVFRFYLNKNERGLTTAVTLHYPLKFKSDQEAKDSVDAAKELIAELKGENIVFQRENWLDLVLKVEFPDGLETLALDRKRFEETVSGILARFVTVIDKVAK